MSSQVDRLKLWEVLQSGGTDAQRNLVQTLADDAAAILDRVVETFPTYTLHNAEHSRNVAGRMADLLGPRVADLSPLEAAMLILAAFWHDVGMVFTEPQRAALASEQNWKAFLDENPEAELEREKAGSLTPELAEWYCRWRHADRVFDHLPKDPLKWGVANIRIPLGELCRSHNQSINEIKANDELQTNYLESADLKFCALLLRLADILDFDNSRSPDAVYRMLGLSRRPDKRVGQSDVEWIKHLCSGGFSFPKVRKSDYKLGFVAGPTHPAVEHDVRKFLDEIEDQFLQCNGLLPFLDDRWRDFNLPAEIGRTNIKSDGYRYGEYQFQLDQRQVLNLLMGENLYEDPHVFVRELLQNAIDTSRYREFTERLAGTPSYKAKPIQVSTWRDPEGRQWVRFDDFGMGMDEPIIRDHLLRVGSSYYQTAKFRAEVIRAQKRGAPDFVPISRFGIGLLSCFIIADRVEINTRHHDPGNNLSQPIRLSLDGLHGFYTLQIGRVQPTPMPSEAGDETGYRRDVGTSIAVRIDPRKERVGFDLRSKLEEFIFASPVPVEFDGEPIGYDYERLIEKPWCEPTVLDLPAEAMHELRALTGYDFKEPCQIAFLPIDLTRHSRTPEFKGQMLAAVFKPSEEWVRFTDLIAPFASIFIERVQSVGNNVVYTELIKFEVFYQTSKYIDYKSFALEIMEKCLTLEDDGAADALRRLAHRVDPGLDVETKGNIDEALSHSSVLTSRVGGPERFFVSSNTSFVVDGLVEALPEQVLVSIRAIGSNQGKLMGHNGVVIPSSNKVFPISPRNISSSLLGPSMFSAPCWVSIALADSLRPDVDVARGTVNRMPLRAYAASTVALVRALEDANLLEFNRSTIVKLTMMIEKEVATLGEILDDAIFEPEDWLQIPLFSTQFGTLSFRELEDRLRYSGDVALNYLPDGIQWSPTAQVRFFDDYAASFCRTAVATLAQTRLGLQIRSRDDKLEGFFVLPGPPRELLLGQKYYPPFTFLPYSDGAFLYGDCGVNLDHPLARWIIEITPMLADRFPGIFSQLREVFVNILYGKMRQDNLPTCVDKRYSIMTPMSEILERMKALGSEFRMPRSATLAVDEIRFEKD